MKALELGAVDFVEKPGIGVSSGLEELEKEILDKVKVAARVDAIKLRGLARKKETKEESTEGDISPKPAKLLKKTTDRLIAIGASTGGTTAVRSILQELPYDMHPIIVIMHMPPGFTRSYAEGLNSVCRIRVKEAVDGEALLQGHAYVAPGGRHLLLHRSGAQYHLKLNDDPPYNRHRPSVDKTFFSVADAAGENVAALLLTGMGSDGAGGLKELKNRGAWTAVQDEKTSVVFGMPKQALALGATDLVFPLPDIPNALIQWASAKNT